MTSTSKKPQRSGWIWALALICVLISIAASQPAEAQTYTILHTFTAGADGAEPQYWLVGDANGNLYGTTWAGGCNPACNYGTVYKIDVNGNESVIHVFPSYEGDGEQPSSALVMDSAGNLYGTTQNGGTPEYGCAQPPGATGCGTVYKLTANAQESVLYNFLPTSAQIPTGPVLLNGGKLYGAASGTTSGGLVYQLGTSSGLAMLYQFTGGTDGAEPFQGLIRNKAGNLYGTTEDGGTSGVGTIFMLDPAGNKTTLHNFTGPDGAYPSGPLLMDATGNLYGVTREGGTSLIGTLFELDTNNNLTVLYSFIGGSQGAYPSGNLFRDGAGNFYGTTEQGGGSKDGTVYKVTPAGAETVLHAFTGSPDGESPSGLLYYRGALYGTTGGGGDPTCQCGIVYKLSQ
jgi:uncharacterized repeat protein (TIGR03803 family)